MTEKVLVYIQQSFNEEERVLVMQELTSIGLSDVMANSEANLEATQLAILKLANADVEEVRRLTKAAKEDFRDVIMWASEDE